MSSYASWLGYSGSRFLIQKLTLLILWFHIFLFIFDGSEFKLKVFSNEPSQKVYEIMHIFKIKVGPLRVCSIFFCLLAKTHEKFVASLMWILEILSRDNLGWSAFSHALNA